MVHDGLSHREVRIDSRHYNQTKIIKNVVFEAPRHNKNVKNCSVYETKSLILGLEVCNAHGIHINKQTIRNGLHDVKFSIRKSVKHTIVNIVFNLLWLGNYKHIVYLMDFTVGMEASVAADKFTFYGLFDCRARYMWWWYGCGIGWHQLQWPHGGICDWERKSHMLMIVMILDTIVRPYAGPVGEDSSCEGY